MGSKPPAAIVVRISKGERHDLGAKEPFSATKSESRKLSFHAETGRGLQSALDPLCRKAIPKHRLYCCSGALRALASLGVC